MEQVSSSNLQGKIWVANFIFTRYAGPCPVMTNRMAELNQALGEKSKGKSLFHHRRS
jgi:protein SCO1/2